MRQSIIFSFILLAVALSSGLSAPAGVYLGDPPSPPTDLSGLPGAGSHPRDVTGSFNVNTSSREQVREFYNAIFTSSEGIPIDSTAVTASCFPGTNSALWVDATLRRINWYRAMAGIPAEITFDSTECMKDQAAALMMSENNELQHVGNWSGWGCFSSDGTNASANSNLALGNDGPDAITAYVLDNGGNNTEVGHRRWILYPQTEIMGTGDIPAEGDDNSANATWVFDANFGGPRPATRTPYVSWPPAGFVPYQVAFPQWSFALSNADLSAATVTMTSNGVPLSVTKQPYVTGYGENTLVWYLGTQDPATDTGFPFGGTDTVYTITIGNIGTSAGTASFTYNVTLFDPSVPGADYSPLVINGPTQPAVGASNPYTCSTDPNPNTTGYQWLVSQLADGDFVDDANNGLEHFTISPTPDYPIITNPPAGSGECFHLCHLDPLPQLLQINESLYLSSSTMLSFSSLLGYATSDETARVQISTDGGASWQDLFAEAGSNGSGESSFTPHNLSLAAYAGQSALLRFNFDYSSGSYYPLDLPIAGWCLEDIAITNSRVLLGEATNATASTNFTLVPAQAGTYLLQVRGVIFDQFPTEVGTTRTVTAIAGSPLIQLSPPVISGSQVKINFLLTSGSATSFYLLQANQVKGPWTTNANAVLTTIVSGSSYQFTTTNGSAVSFYRVRTP